jgi:hypothetical protein
VSARRLGLSALLVGASLASIALAPSRADAFCGFYVAPSDGPLMNDATQVALMRDGSRTVISMSNNYKGPLADFAMVVPVPVVLQKENVKTLPLDAFTKLESLSAPRLVEYWEQDPCAPDLDDDRDYKAKGGAKSESRKKAKEDEGGYGVTVEAKFAVGEYEIVILSAKEADGLERWLTDNKYKIPAGASAALAPYVKEQTKFFVAKVNAQKVQKDAQGVVVLSPLRFNYEETNFRLPVRLGLLNAPPANSNSKQDLIVYVLAENKRYEVANYPNVFIPTNLDVKNDTRGAFGAFYATLFDATLAKAGGRAVVTEYSWQSSSCDPCPTPPLQDSDIATLGGDVLFGMGLPPAGEKDAPVSGSMGKGSMGKGRGGGFYGGASRPVVLTRLHTRYDASTLTEDLVFRAADAVVGGREFVVDDKGNLEQGAKASTYGNNFQARYAIRHEWTGPIACASPRRGIWGGPPAGVEGSTKASAATGLAATPRGNVVLASHVKKGLDDVAEYDKALGTQVPAKPKDGHPPDVPKGPAAETAQKKSCLCAAPGASGEASGLLGLGLGLAGLALARRATRKRR